MKNLNMHLTIVDDNVDFLNSLTPTLSESFKVSAFEEPEQALNFIMENNTDAVLLDLQLKDTHGFQVFERLKKTKMHIPVIFLTGDSDPDTMVKGFDLGGDDFLVKPFNTKELKARILSRIKASNRHLSNRKFLMCKDLLVDLDAHTVTLQDRNVDLTPKEFQLLLMLLKEPNRLITRQAINSALWKEIFVEANNLDTHFSNLRKKLKPFASNIKTVKNMGYVLRV